MKTTNMQLPLMYPEPRPECDEESALTRGLRADFEFLKRQSAEMAASYKRKISQLEKSSPRLKPRCCLLTKG